jgi:hypothetical protein
MFGKLLKYVISSYSLRINVRKIWRVLYPLALVASKDVWKLK